MSSSHILPIFNVIACVAICNLNVRGFQCHPLPLWCLILQTYKYMCVEFRASHKVFGAKHWFSIIPASLHWVLAWILHVLDLQGHQRSRCWHCFPSSSFLLTPIKYTQYEIKYTLKKDTASVRESQCSYLQHLGSICIWGILWLTPGHWPSFRSWDLLGLLWGPGWRSFYCVVKTGHEIEQGIRVVTPLMAKRLYKLCTEYECSKDSVLTVCIRCWAWWSWVWSELETLRPNLHCSQPDLSCGLVGE